MSMAVSAALVFRSSELKSDLRYEPASLPISIDHKQRSSMHIAVPLLARRATALSAFESIPARPAALIRALRSFALAWSWFAPQEHRSEDDRHACLKGANHRRSHHFEY